MKPTMAKFIQVAPFKLLTLNLSVIANTGCFEIPKKFLWPGKVARSDRCQRHRQHTSFRAFALKNDLHLVAMLVPI